MDKKYKFHWLNLKVEVRDGGVEGKGLFAKEKISKDERVLVIGGYILTIDEESKLPGKCRDNGVQITEDLSICITKEDEYEGYNFLNHNCSPNCGFKGQIFLVAMRDIEEDEEITIDYAMVLHKSNNGPRYELECLCGDAHCRKVITDEDWKNKDLQEKYNGYFQYFIQEKIDKN
ncbi:MAG: SET domain-containing protein [bacterium]|nr:SET domain-containing protein [bacterium]